MENTSKAYWRDALHATANICANEAEWNVRIVKLITDLSLTALLCNVFIAQGSFLSHGQTLEDLLVHISAM